MPDMSANTWFTRTNRQRRSKNARPMGALASMESSSDSVSFKPERCSAMEATMRLNASTRSPISLCTVTGSGNLPLSSGDSISARVPRCRIASGREIDRAINITSNAEAAIQITPKMTVLRRIESSSWKSHARSVSTQAYPRTVPAVRIARTPSQRPLPKTKTLDSEFLICGICARSAGSSTIRSAWPSLT